MAVIFAGAPGRVIVLDDPAVQGLLPALVDVERGSLSFSARKTLITRIGLSTETNHQFEHMLGGEVYLYVFGDRIGQMVISGLAASANCDTPGDISHSVEKLLLWYGRNKLSARATPITVMVGQTPIAGYLAGFQADVFDHKLNLIQYNLQMFVPPS